MRRSKKQPREEAFAHFGYAGDHGESWEAPYEKLANMAKPEEWNFQRPEFRKRRQLFPILVNYLNYTFVRCQELDLIRYSGDSRACFNTGLQTPNEKDIFATFYRNKGAKEHDAPDWTFYAFFDRFSWQLSEYHPLPDIASYIESASDLVFDTSYSFDVDYDHLFRDNRDRLPEKLRDDLKLARASIEGNLPLLTERVRRNYKIAIPHWYRGRIQLLLPLDVTDDTEGADLALVAEKDESAKRYRIKTVLTMDMAYKNARLITRPDREWLNP